MRFAKSSAVLSSVVLLALSACGGSSNQTSGATDNGSGTDPVNGRGTTRDGGAVQQHPGSGSNHGGGADAGVATQDSGATTTNTADSGTTTTTSKGQSLVWVWFDYANSLASVSSNAKSFTHVSPALYQINYSYTSGVPQWWNQTSDNFDGLTSTQIATKVHGMGMKVVPLVFAGAGNGGTDQGIQNIIADSPAGTQSAFITSMVSEAVAKGYDGYNLDWEVSNTATTYTTYGADLVSFLGAFKTALHAKSMELSFDLGSWYLKQSWCSGGSGVVDLTTIGSVVDLAIVEDYATTLGTASTSCPASIPNPQSCGTDFMSVLNLMCVYVPNANISIGFNAVGSGSNPIAGDVVGATQAYGIHNVAVWPDYNSDGLGGSYLFMDPKSIQPSTTTWYKLLADFLAAL